MRTARRLRPLLFLATGLTASAAFTAGHWTFKPSVSAAVAYDDNVFLQDRSPLLIAGGEPARAGSWVCRTSVAVDATWQMSPAFRFDAVWAPELIRYEAFDSEDHDDQRLDLGVSGKTGAWSYQLKAGVNVVNGSSDAPVYGRAGGAPALGAPGVRSRRDQATSRFSARLTRDFKAGFVRVVGDSCANDFDTRHSAAPGYANYVDRSEWSAGADLGRNLAPGFAVVAGLRSGEQHQADLLGVPLNSDNSLVRVLAGFEGRPRPDLTLHLLAGPDFRRYGREVAAGFDRTRTARYVEGSALWTPGTADTVAFVCKDFLWLSAGGRSVYQSTTANLKWSHRLGADWSFSAAADVQVCDNRDYTPAASRRDDWIYTGIVGLQRHFGPATTLELEWLHELGDSTLPATPGRDYTRNQISLGARHTF
jgi:hypothetical protein